MAKDDARQHLNLQRRQAGQLRLRKPTDIGDGKIGIRAGLGGKGGNGGLTLGQRHLELCDLDLVELAAKVDDGAVALGPHTRQHIGHQP